MMDGDMYQAHELGNLRVENQSLYTVLKTRNKFIESLEKQLQDTNLLYETYQDLYETSYEREGELEEELFVSKNVIDFLENKCKDLLVDYKYKKEELQQQFTKETMLCNEWQDVREGLIAENKELSNRLSASESDFYELREAHNKLREYTKQQEISCENLYNDLSDSYDKLSASIHQKDSDLFFTTHSHPDSGKYQELLITHAEALEEIITLENSVTKLENEATNYRQMLEVKDKFYECLLASPTNIIEWVKSIEAMEESPNHSSVVFSPTSQCTNNLRDLFLTHLQHMSCSIHTYMSGFVIHFHNKTKICFRTVTDFDKARQQHGGTQANNVLVHSSMTSDLDLCKFLVTRARNSYGYKNNLIVWEN